MEGAYSQHTLLLLGRPSRDACWTTAIALTKLTLNRASPAAGKQRVHQIYSVLVKGVNRTRHTF